MSQLSRSPLVLDEKAHKLPKKGRTFNMAVFRHILRPRPTFTPIILLRIDLEPQIWLENDCEFIYNAYEPPRWV